MSESVSQSQLFGRWVIASSFISLLILIFHSYLIHMQNCCIFWFTCSKVEPSLPTYNTNLQRYKKRQKTNPIGLLSYKNTTSKGFVCEIPETRPTAEYLPRIPDFTDLAGRPDSPGYPASVMFEYENQDSHASGKLSKDVKVRRDNYGLSKSKEQGLSLIASGLGIEDNAGVAHVQRRKRSNTVPHGVATSEVDLSLIEQDYLNRRSYLEEEENEKYYSRAAEEWIHKMVDNLHDSRSRLYAVSDEEDLDEVPKRKKSSEKTDEYPRKASTDSENQQDFSTSTGSRPQNHSSDIEENVDESTRKMSLKSETSSKVERQLSSEKDKNYVKKRKLSIIVKPPVSRRRKFGASSPSDMAQEPNYNNDLESQSECSNTDSQLETSITDIQSEASADNQSKSLGNNHLNSEKDAMENAASDIEHFGTKDLTPHGIVTPIGQPFPTGSLHFEFEKAAPTEHVRQNWVEFEGEPENREKLLKGKMTLKEYEELTSYLM